MTRPRRAHASESRGGDAAPVPVRRGNAAARAAALFCALAILPFCLSSCEEGDPADITGLTARTGADATGAAPGSEQTSAASIPGDSSAASSGASSAVPSAGPTPAPGKDSGQNDCAPGAGNKYMMSLTLDTDAHTIGGTETVIVRNDSGDTWNELCFRDYSSLFVRGGGSGYYSDGAVTEIGGATDITYGEPMEIIRSESDSSVLYMRLSTPLRDGERRKISIAFVSHIPKLEARYGYMEGVYNLGNFYPVLAVYENGGWSTEKYFLWGECFYSVVSDYEATLSVPEGMTIASTGVSNLKATADGRDIWKITAERVRDFALVAGTGYKVLTGEADGVRVNCYYKFRGQSWAEAALEAGIDAMEVFADTYGVYPYPEFDIVETYLDAAGMEYPNLVMISTSLGSYSRMDSTLRIVVVHEAAHQWFYGIVGNNQYTEAWLDESFASYSELVYKETFQDEETVKASVDALEESLEPEGIPLSAEDYYLNRSYGEFGDDYAYMYTVYYRGEVFLYRLREAMGDEPFRDAIRKYVADYSLKEANTGDFLALIRQSAGDSPAVGALLEKYLRQN